MVATGLKDIVTTPQHSCDEKQNQNGTLKDNSDVIQPASTTSIIEIQGTRAKQGEQL